MSETRFSSLAMTSVLSHWLTAKPFVLLLYNCDTTRMVGRPVNSTAIYLRSQNLINPPHIPKKPTSASKPHIYLRSQHLNYPRPHINTYTAYIGIKPPQIPTQPTSASNPTYTYTANILLIPHIYTYTAYIGIKPHIYLHSQHLINPPHIYLHSLHRHQTPTYTYTANISLIKI